MPMVSMEQLMKLQQNAAAEIKNDEEKQGGFEKSPYPLVYTGTNGKLTVRILYNMNSNSIQRKIVRHEIGKKKVPCLEVFGEQCHVCSAIKEAEELRGKECGAKREFGYKVRGFCYAQIVDYSEGYFTDKDIKKKDIVLLMYPKTVYDQINNIIVDAGENLEKIVCCNEGIPIVITRSQKSANAIPDYNVAAYPYGTKKSFEEEKDGKTPDDLFQDLLASLPNLGEQFVSVNPSDEIRTANKAGADVIRQKYVSDKTVNPSDEVIYSNKPDTTPAQIAPAPTSAPSVQQSNKPACFGNHDNNDQNKCLVCQYEVECSMS